MVAFLDFHRHYRRYRREIEAASARVFERGCFILGPELQEFEQRLARYLGAKHAVGVASGTDALMVALKVHGIGPGAEVITVPNTAVPTICAIRNTGALPVLVDVCADTLNLDPALLDGAVTERTRAIVPVHLHGYPARLDAINAVAARHNLVVIEDVAQAIGARYAGRAAGTLGDAGCFSFYPTKNLGAFGDAGAVVTNDDDVAARARRLRNYGETAKYQNAAEGTNSRLDELQAAFLNWGLTHLPAWNERRAELARAYLEGLRGLPVVLPSGGSEIESRVWHLFVIRTRVRDKLRDFLAGRGVQTMIHYPVPVHHQPAYKFLQPPWPLPVADELAGEILSLPLYPEMDVAEVNEVCGQIKSFHDLS